MRKRDFIKLLANDPHRLLVPDFDEGLKLYLDWWNNYMTFSAFADYYGMTEDEALAIINMGRKEDVLSEAITKGAE